MLAVMVGGIFVVIIATLRVQVLVHAVDLTRLLAKLPAPVGDGAATAAAVRERQYVATLHAEHAGGVIPSAIVWLVAIGLVVVVVATSILGAG